MKRKAIFLLLISAVAAFILTCVRQYRVEATVAECRDTTTGYVMPISCGADGTLGVDGVLTTSPEAVSTIDPVNGTINAGATAGITFAATASWFIIENESTGAIRVCPACTASSTAGLYLSGGGAIAADGLSITSMTLYNQSSSAVTYSVLSGRKP